MKDGFAGFLTIKVELFSVIFSLLQDCVLMEIVPAQTDSVVVWCTELAVLYGKWKMGANM